MALPEYRWLTSLDLLGNVYRDVLRGGRRLVGWGTGSVFHDLYRRCPVRLEYLVDNNPERWGRQVAGLDVHPPERLRAEDPQTTLVLVYSSFWPEILRQAAQENWPSAVPASHLLAWPTLGPRLDLLHRFATAPRPRGGPRSDSAVVVQGPIIADLTPLVLRYYAAANPGCPIVLSTWSDTPREVLDAVSADADEIVLSEKPGHAGTQNRNLQIVSTTAGLRRARAMGASFALKTRTDLVALTYGVADLCRRLLVLYDSRAARSAGQRGRLIVPQSFTRKYLLYHPSDLLQFGYLEDLVRYWSAPLDTGTDGFPGGTWPAMRLPDLARRLQPAETYLAVNFLDRLGLIPAFHLQDSWAFYRDFLVVMDDAWFDLLWLKNPETTRPVGAVGLRELVTHQWWLASCLGSGIHGDWQTVDDVTLGQVMGDEQGIGHRT